MAFCLFFGMASLLVDKTISMLRLPGSAHSFLLLLWCCILLQYPLRYCTVMGTSLTQFSHLLSKLCFSFLTPLRIHSHTILSFYPRRCCYQDKNRGQFSIREDDHQSNVPLYDIPFRNVTCDQHHFMFTYCGTRRGTGWIWISLFAAPSRRALGCYHSCCQEYTRKTGGKVIKLEVKKQTRGYFVVVEDGKSKAMCIFTPRFFCLWYP